MTLRELVWMADARRREAWNHTADLLAMLVNCHRDPKRGREARRADFHPLQQSTSGGGRGLVITGDNIRILKTIFVDSQK